MQKKTPVNPQQNKQLRIYQGFYFPETHGRHHLNKGW